MISDDDDDQVMANVLCVADDQDFVNDDLLVYRHFDDQHSKIVVVDDGRFCHSLHVDHVHRDVCETMMKVLVLVLVMEEMKMMMKIPMKMMKKMMVYLYAHSKEDYENICFILRFLVFFFLSSLLDLLFFFSSLLDFVFVFSICNSRRRACKRSWFLFSPSCTSVLMVIAAGTGDVCLGMVFKNSRNSSLQQKHDHLQSNYGHYLR